jgi:MarR family
MADRRSHRGTITIDLTGIERKPVRVGAAPDGTAVLLGLTAFARPDLGGPTAQRQIVRNAASASTAEVFHTIGHPSTHELWEGLLPRTTPADHWDYTVEQNHMDPDELCDFVTSTYGDPPPAPWLSVRRHPKRFLSDYVRACREILGGVQPILGRADRLIDREVERIGTAVVRQSLPELLAGLYTGARLEQNVLSIPARRDKWLTIGANGLTISPILASVARGGHTFDGAELTSLWYPLPGIGALFQRASTTASAAPDQVRPDGLAALLGAPRAALLRGLDHPASAGQLAAMLGAGGSSVTYHVDTLVAAGLVQRCRRGRTVVAFRTDRGEQLINLYQR